MLLRRTFEKAKEDAKKFWHFLKKVGEAAFSSPLGLLRVYTEIRDAGIVATLGCMTVGAVSTFVYLPMGATFATIYVANYDDLTMLTVGKIVSWMAAFFVGLLFPPLLMFFAGVGFLKLYNEAMQEYI